MHILMIPTSQLSSSSVGAASNGFNIILFHPFHASNAPTPRCAIASPPQFPQLSGYAQTIAFLRFHSPPPTSHNSRFELGGFIDAARRGLSSSPFSPVNPNPRFQRGSSIDAARRSLPSSPSSPAKGGLGSIDGSSRGPSGFTSTKGSPLPPVCATGDAPEQPSQSQKSKILSSVSKLQEKLQAMDSSDGEDSDSDSDDEGDGGKVVTSEGTLGGEESGMDVVHEYKLTEDGNLSTVTVTFGGISHATRSNVAGMLAEVGMQAEVMKKTIRNFSVRKFIQNWGKKEPSLEDLKFSAAMYAPKEGISNITQWTATELTLQRAQMVRIARDTQYLVWAFSLFGIVRILEAVATVFSTSPPNFMKIFDGLNALDPLTIASLAHAMRQPVVGMLDVDPTNLEEVSSLKVKFWAELHKFYERQWKVMATLGFARLLTLIVIHLPSAEWITTKVKVMWDISMALPIF